MNKLNTRVRFKRSRECKEGSELTSCDVGFTSDYFYIKIYRLERISLNDNYYVLVFYLVINFYLYMIFFCYIVVLSGIRDAAPQIITKRLHLADKKNVHESVINNS